MNGIWNMNRQLDYSMNILSTYKILKIKAFEESIDETCIDWAIEMVEAGYESENLYMLAGQTKPYNQFHLWELTDKVLKDLNLDYTDKDLTIRNYVYYLISVSINDPDTYIGALRELRDFYIHSPYSQFSDFYLLYYARDELMEYKDQQYWEGANRDNIDLVIKNQFQKWLNEFEQQQPKTNS